MWTLGIENEHVVDCYCTSLKYWSTVVRAFTCTVGPDRNSTTVLALGEYTILALRLIFSLQPLYSHVVRMNISK